MVHARVFLLIALLAGLPAHAQLPWRIGAPEVVWRYEPPAEAHDLVALAVHPEGGVVAMASETYSTLFRIAPSGSKLWQRTIVERGSGRGRHLMFLRRDQGVDTIVVGSGTMTVLEPSGAVRWTRSNAEIGIEYIGVAIAGHVQAGARTEDWIVVVGEGVGDQREAIPMAAGLTSDGTRRWLAVVPQPVTAAPSQRANRGRVLDATMTLPLRVLDDGGAVLLVGCDPQRFWNYHPEDYVNSPTATPCTARSPMSLVTIDGSGRTTSVILAGTEPWRARFDRWDLQPAAWVDMSPAPLLRGGWWDRDEFPQLLPSVWWFGPSTPRIVQFLRRWIYPRSAPYPGPAPFLAYEGGRTSPQPPSLAAFPAADMVVEGEVAYLVLAPARDYGPRRVILLAVRLRGMDVLAAGRARPPLDRVRYAPHESALYALVGNEVVRMRIVRPR